MLLKSPAKQESMSCGLERLRARLRTCIAARVAVTAAVIVAVVLIVAVTCCGVLTLFLLWLLLYRTQTLVTLPRESKSKARHKTNKMLVHDTNKVFR